MQRMQTEVPSNSYSLLGIELFQKIKTEFIQSTVGAVLKMWFLYCFQRTQRMQTELQKSTDRDQLQMGDIFISEDAKDTNLIPKKYRQS